MLHQRDRFPDDVIDVERHLLNVGLVRERPDAPDYFTRPIAFIDDPVHGGARFVQVGGTAVEPTPAGRRGIDDGGEWLVHFMGDGGCQFAQRRHARYACELHLGIEEALLASPQLLFCPLAVGHVDDKDNPLVWFPLEKSAPDQYRNAAAVFAEKFLLERLAAPGRAHLGQRILIGGGPLGGRQLRPPYPTRDKVFTAVAQHVEKGVVRFDDPAPRIPDHDSDDVRVDQAANPGLPFPEIVVQAHVFDGDHRLLSEGLDKRDLIVGEWSDLPPPDQNCSNGDAPAQQRCRERGAMALAFCESAAHPVLALLYSEIMDMNGPTIACGSSVHRVSVYEKTPVRMDIHWNFPV